VQREVGQASLDEMSAADAEQLLVAPVSGCQPPNYQLPAIGERSEVTVLRQPRRPLPAAGFALGWRQQQSQ
jgi:hypothetical protein